MGPGNAVPCPPAGVARSVITDLVPALDVPLEGPYTYSNRRPPPARGHPPAGGFSFHSPMQRLSLFVASSVLLLSACSARPPVIQTPSIGPPVPSRPPTRSPTQGPASYLPPTATQSPSPSTAAPQCTPREGKLEQLEIESSVLVRDLPATLYLPPCYEPGEARGYPVLVLLHGLTGNPQQWLDFGLKASADQLIASGEAPPFLVALPWNRTGIAIEPGVTKVLLPYLEQHYHALPGRTWRAIGGFSRGGGWAFHIGFANPELFQAVGLHSPGLLAGDLTSLDLWLDRNAGQQPPRVWIDIGESDSLLESTSELSDRLLDLGIDHQFIVRPGDHSTSYWSQHVREYLQWYTARW